MNLTKIKRMKECKVCGCYTDEKCEICITCQSKQWKKNLGDEYTFVIHIELVNSGFEKELSDLINRHSLENGSDTPDFVLAKYLSDCLTTFNKAIEKRDEWYKFKPWGRLTNLENPERNGNDS